MKNLLQDIKNYFNNNMVLYRLVLINVVVFIGINFFDLFGFLFGWHFSLDRLMRSFFGLEAGISNFIWKPWTIFSYMFLHDDIFHILFNMLFLTWTGKLFSEYLGNQKLSATYFLGGICGGLFYMVAYQIFPAFANHDQAILIGASAGVLGVFFAAATLLPKYTTQLLFIGSIKLKFLAIIMFLLYAFSIPSGNAGGHIAHIGGALFGFVSIKFLQSGTDITKWFSKLFSFKSRSRKNMKVVYRSNENADEIYLNKQRMTQENLDRILDKINRSGFDSLTADEKEFLYKASGK
ncbi:MAG: rhomboid family intramembrane serine protease [Bacteroidota bacterium]